MSQSLNILFDGPRKANRIVVLAHGAGAPMNSPFMNTIAKGLAHTGLRVARFEFLYMRARRKGRCSVPEREPILLQTWRDVIEHRAADAIW